MVKGTQNRPDQSQKAPGTNDGPVRFLRTKELAKVSRISSGALRRYWAASQTPHAGFGIASQTAFPNRTTDSQMRRRGRRRPLHCAWASASVWCRAGWHHVATDLRVDGSGEAAAMYASRARPSASPRSQ
jgi:hypothetical protein